MNIVSEQEMQPDEFKKICHNKQKKDLDSLGTFKVNFITLNELHTYLYYTVFISIQRVFHSRVLLRIF